MLNFLGHILEASQVFLFPIYLSLVSQLTSFLALAITDNEQIITGIR